MKNKIQIEDWGYIIAIVLILLMNINNLTLANGTIFDFTYSDSSGGFFDFFNNAVKPFVYMTISTIIYLIIKIFRR